MSSGTGVRYDDRRWCAMARLDLEIRGYNEVFNKMIINGKEQKIQKDKAGLRTCSVDIDSNTAEIVVYKGHYYAGRFWLFWNILFFLVSLFGIFDMRDTKKFQVVDLRFNVSVKQDTKVSLQVRDFEDGGRFVDITSDSQIEEISNISMYDKEAPQRKQKAKKVKIFIMLALVALAAVLIIF